MTERLTVEELHNNFLENLDQNMIEWHSVLKTKPLEFDLKPPLPTKVRLYIYNATKPPGGRTIGEHKIQLIVPGQKRGERGSFDASGGRIVLLVGYESENDLFIFWDAGMYQDFAYSGNVQVMPKTIYEAFVHGIALQERVRRGIGQEVIVVCKASQLVDGLIYRMDFTRERLQSNG